MSETFRRMLAGLLCAELSMLGITPDGRAGRQATYVSETSKLSTDIASQAPPPLRLLLQKSYVELFDLAPTKDFRKVRTSALPKNVKNVKPVI